MDLEKLRVESFNIKVWFANANYSLKVEQTFLSATKEIFTIIDEGQSFQITSTRPLIKQDAYSRKKPTYKAIDGRIERMRFFEDIIAAIQSHLKDLEIKPYGE